MTIDTVAPGETAESHLDALIERRDKQRRKAEGERPAEEIYEASYRRYRDRERDRRLWAEVRYREQMIRSHTATLSALVDGHQRALERALELLGIDETKGEAA